ncbi:MAG: hypothetical protein ACD_19C00429G0089 [uncultured bacterium]|nr:MAG: hypothetical protein ACD_19C00429G0089 [uncultured bacterium]
MENQIPVAPVVTPQVVVEQPKQNNFLTTLLSTLLIISVTISGFFAFQTQKLVKELTSLKSEEKVVAIVTTEPANTTPAIVSLDSVTNTSTGQKLYEDKLHKFEFSYPVDYSSQINQNSYYIMSPLLPPTKGYELRDGELKVEFYFNPIKENDTLTKYLDEIKSNSDAKILSETRIKINGTDTVHLQLQGLGETDLYLLIHNGYRFQIVKYPMKTSRQSEFNQILSTFKFLD